MDRCQRQWLCIHDEDGTIGHGFIMDIEKGLSIRERTCYACIAHLDTKASELEEGKSSLICRPVSSTSLRKLSFEDLRILILIHNQSRTICLTHPQSALLDNIYVGIKVYQEIMPQQG